MAKRDLPETKSIWINGKLVPWKEATVHVLAHALHYGSGVFEGIRAYKTEKGPAVFRLAEHIDRLLYSAGTLDMELDFSRDELIQATLDTIADNKLESCYIRPLIFYGYGIMGLNPTGAPVETLIACWPWGAYLPFDMIDLKISKYIRIHPESLVSDAKVTGHYVNSILSVLDLKGSKYHEALLLDYNGDIAEGPGENFFIVKDGKLYTPPKGTILVGITRDTIMKLAADMKIEVIEKKLRPADAFAADECFYTGTAAEVTPIRSIDDHVIGKGECGPITTRIQDRYKDVVEGRDPIFEHMLTYV